jgi:hypothetical protein
MCVPAGVLSRRTGVEHPPGLFRDFRSRGPRISPFCSGFWWPVQARNPALNEYKSLIAQGFALAAREGLEPPTFALGKRCSILLSYRADRLR